MVKDLASKLQELFQVLNTLRTKDLKIQMNNLMNFIKRKIICPENSTYV